MLQQYRVGSGSRQTIFKEMTGDSTFTELSKEAAEQMHLADCSKFDFFTGDPYGASVNCKHGSVWCSLAQQKFAYANRLCCLCNARQEREKAVVTTTPLPVPTLKAGL